MLDVIKAGIYMKDKDHVVSQEVRELLGVRFSVL